MKNLNARAAVCYQQSVAPQPLTAPRSPRDLASRGDAFLLESVCLPRIAHVRVRQLKRARVCAEDVEVASALVELHVIRMPIYTGWKPFPGTAACTLACVASRQHESLFLTSVRLAGPAEGCRGGVGMGKVRVRENGDVGGTSAMEAGEGLTGAGPHADEVLVDGGWSPSLRFCTMHINVTAVLQAGRRSLREDATDGEGKIADGGAGGRLIMFSEEPGGAPLELNRMPLRRCLMYRAQDSSGMVGVEGVQDGTCGGAAEAPGAGAPHVSRRARAVADAGQADPSRDTKGRALKEAALLSGVGPLGGSVTLCLHGISFTSTSPWLADSATSSKLLPLSPAASRASRPGQGLPLLSWPRLRLRCPLDFSAAAT